MLPPLYALERLEILNKEQFLSFIIALYTVILAN